MTGPAAELRSDGSIWLAPLVAERMQITLSQRWRAQAAVQGAWAPWQLEVLRALTERVRWADVLEGAGLPFEEPDTAGTGKIEVSAPEAAVILGCSPRWVRDLAHRGAIPARLVGGRWLVTIDQEDIAA